MAALQDRPADDPAQHVAAVLVGRDDAVGDQERERAPVIGEHTQRLVGRELLAVAPSRELLAERDQRRELVGLEHGRLALEDRRHPIEPEAGVDVVGRKRREHVDRVLVELHEHQVPVLEEALVVAAREIVGLTVVDAAIEVQLRAGTAGAGRPRLPEVLRARALDDPLARHADLEPRLDRVLVGTESELIVAGEHGDPDVVAVEPEALQRQIPGEPDRLALEVVAEREVPEHLEEREVPGGGADDLDVGRAERLLAGGQPRVRRPLDALEIGLERVHPRDREQRRRVVLGRDQRRRGQPQMVARDEELRERPADLIGGHGTPQCRRGHRSSATRPGARSSPTRSRSRRPSGRRSAPGRRRRQARRARRSATGRPRVPRGSGRGSALSGSEA